MRRVVPEIRTFDSSSRDVRRFSFCTRSFQSFQTFLSCFSNICFRTPNRSQPRRTSTAVRARFEPFISWRAIEDRRCSAVIFQRLLAKSTLAHRASEPSRLSFRYYKVVWKTPLILVIFNKIIICVDWRNHHSNPNVKLYGTESFKNRYPYKMFANQMITVEESFP